MATRSYHGIGAPLLLATAIGTSATLASAAESLSPYTGQQTRAIKSLSDQDVTALLAGQGAGFAKAAELNGYPGPAHVLELATPLHLDASQLTATKALMAEHQVRARLIGADLLDAEAVLDRLFAQKEALPRAVDQATQKIVLLRGRLRAEHLKTHLSQTALLSPEQTQLYSALRGYELTETTAPRADPDAASSPAHHHH